MMTFVLKSLQIVIFFLLLGGDAFSQTTVQNMKMGENPYFPPSPFPALDNLKPGDEIDVTFNGGDIEKCQFSHKSSFSCDGPQGEAIVSKSTSGDWSSIQLSVDGKISTASIDSVSRNGVVYFKHTLEGYNEVSKTADMNTDGSRLNYLNANFFGNAAHPKTSDSPFASLDRAKDSPAFTKVYTQIKTAAVARLKEINKTFAEVPTVKVTFKGGLSSTCSRGKTSSQSKTVCELFTCDPVTIDGKKFTPLLDQPSEPGGFPLPNATLFSDKGPGPILSAETVIDAASGEKVYHASASKNWGSNGDGNGAYSAHTPASFNLPKGFKNDPLFQKSMDDSRFSSMRYYLGNQCASPEIVDRIYKEDLWIHDKQKILDEQDLVVLVSNFNGSKETLITPRKLLPKNTCLLYGDTFETKTEDGKGLNSTDPPPEKVFSQEEADRIFNEVASMKDIPFGYTADGCFARAEIMSDRLAKEGVQTQKVWVRGGTLTPTPDIRWVFHVAPVIWVRAKDGSSTREVLDPSLENHAVSVEDWMKKFHPDQGKALNVPWPVPPIANAPYQRTLIYYTPSSIYALGESLPDAKQINANLLDAKQVLEQNMIYQKEQETHE